MSTLACTPTLAWQYTCSEFFGRCAYRGEDTIVHQWDTTHVQIPGQVLKQEQTLYLLQALVLGGGVRHIATSRRHTCDFFCDVRQIEKALYIDFLRQPDE